MRHTTILLTLVCLSFPAAAAELPKYDAALLKDYAARPESFESNHEQILKVVQAQTTKFYVDVMTEEMRKHKITEPVTPVRTLNDFNTYFASLPTAVLSDMAHARQNLVFEMAVLTAESVYESTHNLPQTVLPPPSVAPNVPPSPPRAAQASSHEIETSHNAKPETLSQLKDLQERIAQLNQKDKSNERLQLIFAIVAGLGLVLGLVGIIRR